MAGELAIFDHGFAAGEDLSNDQFKLMKLSADRTVIKTAAATDQVLGILQNNPKSGEQASVRLIGISKVVASAALAVNDLIGASATAGQAAKKTPNVGITEEFYCGVIIGDAVSAAGSIATAFIFGMNFVVTT